MTTRYFALIVGIIYVLVGILGFFPGLIHPPGPGDPNLIIETFYGRLLGIFPINILHNLVHLAVGVWGVAAYRSYSGARNYAKGLTILYALLAIMGLIPVLRTTFDLIPIFGNDVWLHAGTALVAAYFGWATPERERVSSTYR